MRNLCTIQTIATIKDIEGKDKIGFASFVNSGFNVIVDKTEMKPGDQVVYCEVDTVLPEHPCFEFLRKRSWNEQYKGFRIKNMKMCGYYSEGFAFKLSTFLHEFVFTQKKTMTVGQTDGTDVTSYIGAVKFDPELIEENSLAITTNKKHNFIVRYLLKFKWFKNVMYPPRKSTAWPAFVSKTDETRVQSLVSVLAKAVENEKNKLGFDVYVTEKIDGQSCTIGYNKKDFFVCSRNLRLPFNGKYDSNYWKIVKQYDLEKKLKKLNKNIYIQGEIAGPGIQKNKYDFKDLNFFVFNIKDINSGEYYGLHDMIFLCHQLGLTMVPVVDAYTADQRFFTKYNTVEKLVEYSQNKSCYADIPREGIVVRASDPKKPERGMSNMFSFKVINPDFTLKFD